MANKRRTKTAAKSADQEYFCNECGQPLSDENCRNSANSVTGFSAFCVECEEQRYDSLRQIEGEALALFHCCAAFDVPCKPLVMGGEKLKDIDAAWIAYINRLSESGADRKGDRILGFADGETDILRIFGKDFTERDFAKYVQSERERLSKLAGTEAQRDRWGDGYTTEAYNELDRLYEVRAESYRGQTLTPQMIDTLEKVAKWNYHIDELIKKNNIKGAKDMQSMVDSVLASEQMRKKDEKPQEQMRVDAMVTALENNGLMENGQLLTFDELIDVFSEHFFQKKKYAYGKDILDKVIEDMYNTLRRNADLVNVDALPGELNEVDELHEFADEDSEDTKKRKRYVNFIPTQFEKPTDSEVDE